MALSGDFKNAETERTDLIMILGRFEFCQYRSEGTDRKSCFIYSNTMHGEFCVFKA